ncbi:hypothetical protein F5887DRAFT_968646 [Amanita rubescens]|nr:hypothetical protein F5887DRAFT_968646 [Amanita rubescens]
MTRSRLANWCQHCGQRGHLVQECNAYLSHIPGVNLPPQSYAHDPGCVSLHDAVNFIRILSTIRRHLYTSTDTQSHYISIAQDFYSKLSGGSSGGILDHQPCREDFLSFVVDHWPTFRSIEGSENSSDVLWGRVSKQAKSLHEVGILSSLVSAAEVAATNNRPGLLALPLYNLIITVVILHELSHSFTKYLFNNIITPEGVGPTRRRHGESGWLLEARLMPHGFVSASWDCEGDVGQMKLIKRVVLEKGSGAAYIINVDTATKILQSLGSSHFTPPSADTLAEFLGGSDFRARVTETTTCPNQEVVAPVGLGIRSFLGSDRWKTPW